jgi:HEPN domain-containing protein
MIYLKDIHKYDDQFMADKEYMETAEFIESCRTDIDMARAHAQALDEFGLFTEAAEESVNKGVSGVIRTLGKKIIELVEKIKNMIKDFTAKWKAKLWESKSQEQKIREIVRKYPKQADQIKAAVSANELSFATYKDLEEFYKSADEILDAIEKRKIDPKSLRGRWEGVKKKIHDNEKLIATTATVIGAAVGVAGAVITVKKYKLDKDKYELDASKFEFEKLKQTQEYNANSASRISNKCKVISMSIENVVGEKGFSGHGNDDADREALIAEILNEISAVTGETSSKVSQLYGHLVSQFLNTAMWVLKDHNRATTVHNVLGTAKDAANHNLRI